MSPLAITLPVSFEEPLWLWLLCLIPVLVLVSIRSLAGLGPVRRVAALFVRSLVVLAVTLALADVQRVRRNKNVTVVFLMDRSLSVRGQVDTQEAYMEAVCKDMPNEDRVGVIDFARSPYLEQLPMQGGYFLERGRLPEIPNPERTDVAAAIRLAMAMFPHDTAKRIVLMSDGNDNMGDALSEARRAAAAGVVIDVAPLWYQIRNEVFFDKIVAPTSAEVGEVIAVRMNIRSNQSASGRIDVYHNDRKVDLPPDVARKMLVPGNNPFVLKFPVETPGVQRFEARFIPDDPTMDTIAQNNNASTFSFVSGKGRVAVMTMNPSHDQSLIDALTAEKIDVLAVDLSHEVPDLAQLIDFSAIILANVPANVFTDDQQQMLASYVTDLGGGLIMTGGDESFGAGGWIGTPIQDVLPVELEIKHKKVIPRGALAIIMHSCELPRGNFWGKLVAKKSVDTISSRDYIGVLAYAAGGESWEVPLGLATRKKDIKAAIDRMIIGDMPDFDSTLQMAFKGLEQTDAAQKHVIVISDGDAQPPTPSLLQKMVSAKITCSTIAIGYGQHVTERTLRDIASKTGGRFYPVRNPRALPQIFVKESKVVRRPLIVEEPFVPSVLYGASELIAGVQGDPIPPLGGLILTSPKSAPAFSALVRNTADGQDPVLAYWQRGLGRAVAFTSGYWPKWGTEWTVWAKFSKLWAQIVRWSMRHEAPPNFETRTRIEGNQGRIIVEALDKNADYLNFLALESKLIHPTRGPESIRFIQTGPGRYESTFDVDQSGQYIANVAVYQEGQYQGSLHTGVSMPFSPELREMSTNEPLLREAVEITGGRWLDMDPARDDVFTHNLPPTLARQPAWEWTVAWLLLPLFLLDVAVRRLASWLAMSIIVELIVLVVFLFGLGILYANTFAVVGTIAFAELIGWTLRFQYIRPMFDWLTHTVTALGGAGERSTASLEQLKHARDRVRKEPGDETKPTQQPTTTPKPTVDRTRKFDSRERAERTPDRDLSDALGGAEVKPAQPKPGERKSGETDSAESDEATTSRLLRAKRRAQGKKKDDDTSQDH